MSDNPIMQILYRREADRQLAQSGATTDDRINSMLAMLRSNRATRDRMRQKRELPLMGSGEEEFEGELERLLNDPNAPVRDVEDFRAKFAFMLQRNGFKIISNDVERALQAKIAQVQIATIEPQLKNDGGRPRKFRREDLYMEAFKVVYAGDVKTITGLRNHLHDWYGRQKHTDKEQLSEGYLTELIREVIREFRKEPFGLRD